MLQHTEFLTDLHKNFQIASVHEINVEYQICCFCCNLFLSYADNRHTDTHRPFAKYVFFGFRGPQSVSIHQNLDFEYLTQKQYFLYVKVRESNKSLKFVTNFPKSNETMILNTPRDNLHDILEKFLTLISNNLLNDLITLN